MFNQTKRNVKNINSQKINKQLTKYIFFAFSAMFFAYSWNDTSYFY